MYNLVIIQPLSIHPVDSRRWVISCFFTFFSLLAYDPSYLFFCARRYFGFKNFGSNSSPFFQDPASNSSSACFLSAIFDLSGLLSSLSEKVLISSSSFIGSYFFLSISFRTWSPFETHGVMSSGFLGQTNGCRISTVIIFEGKGRTRRRFFKRYGFLGFSCDRTFKMATLYAFSK